MRLPAFISNFQNQHYGCLELEQLSEESVWHFIRVGYKSKELHVHSEHVNCSSEALASLCPKSLPVILAVNTPEVISKLVPWDGVLSTEQVLTRNFPNMDMDRFYWSAAASGNQMLLHLAKKEYIDTVLEKTGNLQKQVVRIVLGSSAAPALASYLSDAKLPFGNNMLHIEQGTIVALDKYPKVTEESVSDAQSYTVQGLELKKHSILPFASILLHLSTTQQATNLAERNAFMTSKFAEGRTFERLLKGALVFFLIILLSNFLVFDSYYRDTELLKNQLEVSASQVEAFKQQQTRLTEMEERIQLLNQTANSRVSYYLDQIARQVPASIVLEKMAYQPLLTPVRDNKPIQLETHTLLIHGISQDDLAFSNWISSLEQLPWVASVITTDYDHIRSNQSQFGLKIEVRHEDAP